MKRLFEVSVLSMFIFLWLIGLALANPLSLPVPAFKDVDGVVYYPLAETAEALGGQVWVDFSTETINVFFHPSVIKVPVVIPTKETEVNDIWLQLQHEIFSIKAGNNSIIYVPDYFFVLAGIKEDRLTTNNMIEIEKMVPDLANDCGTSGIPGIPAICLNGQSLVMEVPPIIENGRTLVPMRAIFEALGAKVEWDGQEYKVTGELDGNVVKLWINNKRAIVNGKEVELEVPAKIINGRTMVPLRFIGENLEFKIHWLGEKYLIVIRN